MPDVGDRLGSMIGDRGGRTLAYVEADEGDRRSTIPEVWQWKYPQLIELWRHAGAVDDLFVPAGPVENPT